MTPVPFSSIESVDHLLPDRFFAPVTTFLTYNLMAVAGNLLTTNGLPIPGPDRLWIPVCLRFLLIPAMLFCNYRPATRVVPVIFKSDLIYTALSAIQGLTMGYLLSLSVMYAPKMVSLADSPTVGMMIGITGEKKKWAAFVLIWIHDSRDRHDFFSAGSHHHIPLARPNWLITTPGYDSSGGKESYL